MGWHSLSTRLIQLLTCVCLACAPSAMSQEKSMTNIALSINQDQEQFAGYSIAFDGNNATERLYNLPSNRDISFGRAPGGVLVRVERVKNEQYACRVQLDANGDGNLADETAHVIVPDSSIMVWVNRKWPNGRKLTLPYTIKYSRDLNRANQIEESFFWIAHYRAEGKLKVKGCESKFVVLDLNGDGLFDNDSGRGSNIGLDRNGDQRIWGSEEYLHGNQIIEFCNDAFLVERLEADGTSLTLARTSLRVPKLSEKLPTFVLTTLDGKQLRSGDLRGKVHLLDFWASWCQPCVEKFPLVKQLGEDFKDTLTIIAVNVDEMSRMEMARQVIKDYQLPWLHVMSGRGETDPVWKMFGGMEGNRLSIPLYVLVDDKGQLQYAGNGGDDLSGLRTRLSALLKTSRAKIKD